LASQTSFVTTYGGLLVSVNAENHPLLVEVQKRPPEQFTSRHPMAAADTPHEQLQFLVLNQL
jgi:hypothetical protein